MIRTVITSIAILFLIASASRAQQAGTPDTGSELKELTLERALNIAETNNYEVQKAQKETEIQKYKYRKTNALFLPSITLEEQASTTTDPLNAFGFKLKREEISQADFNPLLLNDPDRTDLFSTRLTVEQPLINVDGFYERNAMSHQRKAADKKLTRTRHYTRFQVKKTYYRLLLLRERINVLDSALIAAKAHRDQAQDYMEQGMVNRADYLEARVRVLNLESDRSEAQNNYSKTEQNLRYMLGMDGDTELKPVDSLKVESTPQKPTNYARINSNRSDMQAIEHKIEASEAMLNSSKSQFLPSINVMGQYEFNDDTPFGTGAENYMVGASLKWNLFNGFKNIASWQESKQKMEKARIARRQQAARNKVQINDAYQSILHAQTSIEKSRASVEQAKENLRIRKDRYDQGMENTTDLLSAEVKLQEAKVRKLKALYAYNVNLAQLELMLEKEL